MNQATSSTNNGQGHIEFGGHGARNTNGGTVGGFDRSVRPQRIIQILILPEGLN